MSKVIPFFLNVLLVASIGLRGVEQATTDSKVTPIQTLAQLHEILHDDDLAGLKKQVNAGLNLKTYEFPGKRFQRKKLIARHSPAFFSPLIEARSPEMVDFLVSQGWGVNDHLHGENPLEMLLLHEANVRFDNFEKAFNQENWPVVLRHLKLIKAIDRLKELGATLGSEESDRWQSYKAFKQTALNKIDAALEQHLKQRKRLSPALRAIINSLEEHQKYQIPEAPSSGNVYNGLFKKTDREK